MNDAQVKHMVDRFLAWRLPEHFEPDCGIRFFPTYNTGTSVEGRNLPFGTNLFDATQAEAMVRAMLVGLPGDTEPAATSAPASGMTEAERDLLLAVADALSCDANLAGSVRWNLHTRTDKVRKETQ